MSTDSSPASNFFAITKSDTVNFTTPSKVIRGIYVGGTGDVVAIGEDGLPVTFSAVPVGAILPIRCIRVNSTNTTATLMVALV
jgi:hypothetical protein